MSTHTKLKKMTWHTPPTIICPSEKCGRVLMLSSFFPQDFFNRKKACCSSCGAKFDLWGYAVDLLRKEPQLFRNKGAAFIGGQEVSFTFQLPPNETVEVDLKNYGVPENARLIYIVYTPSFDAGWPLEVKGNQPLQYKTKHKMIFFGRPFPKGDLPESNKHDVSMSVTYIPRGPDQIHFENLALAYEYFLSDDYEKMIIPCAVALEDAIEQVTVGVLANQKLPTSLNPSKRLSLEVVIPLVCELNRLPMLENTIIERVIELWGVRNDMAHRGRPKKTIDLERAANLLAAAMFCLNFLIFLRESIKK